MMKIGIIGGGAAGIAAALEASKNGAQVLLLDANSVLGRKLSVTGSGRCNITNMHADDADKYTCREKTALKKILSQFEPDKLIAFLQDAGIPTYATSDGWVYPLSNSASNVATILEKRLRTQGAEIHLQTLITDIRIKSGGFILTTANPDVSYHAECVIVATGSPAFPQSGARDNLYEIFQRMGHTIRPVLPALAPILTDPRPLHKLQGVRLDAGVQLLHDGQVLASTKGNIIFTRWGINGPGVMDLSHLVSQNANKRLTLCINLIPYQESALMQMLSNKANEKMPLLACLLAFLPAKAAHFMLKNSGMQEDLTLKETTHAEKQHILHTLKSIEVEVRGTREFNHSQLSTGGIPLSEIDTNSMQSKIIGGLYFAGEILDVLGPCGGYNLHWAFASGILAGRSATTLPHPAAL